MQKFFAFLFIGLVIVWIQHANGTPLRYLSSESDEDLDAPVKAPSEPKWVADGDGKSSESGEAAVERQSVLVEVNESDQSSEEKQKVAHALELTRDLENLSDQNTEQDSGSDDQGANAASFSNDNHRRQFVEDDDTDED